MTFKTREILVVFAGLGLAGLAFLSALSMVARQAAVDVPLQIGWSNSANHEEKGTLMFWADFEDPPLNTIAQHARTALEKTALSPRALSLLGFVSDRKGDRASAEKFVRLAERLSARDVMAQLWLIEDAARRTDTSSTVKRLDLLLRTSPATSELVFPILSKALEDKAFRREFVSVVRDRPIWLPGATFYLSGNTKDPAIIAIPLIEGGGLSDQPGAPEAQRRLLEQTILRSSPEVARRYYLSLTGTRETDLFAAGFNANSVNASFQPIAWEALEQSNAEASFVTDGNSGRLILIGGVSGGLSADIARKTLLLDAGVYRLRVDGEVDPAGAATILAKVTCLVSDAPPRVLAEQGVLGTRAIEFTVPRGCPVQVLTLALTSEANELNADFSVRAANLNRLR